MYGVRPHRGGGAAGPDDGRVLVRRIRGPGGAAGAGRRGDGAEAARNCRGSRSRHQPRSARRRGRPTAGHARRALDVRARVRSANAARSVPHERPRRASASRNIPPRCAPPARSSITCATRRRPTWRTSASITYKTSADCLLIDAVTLKHLEIVESMDGGRDGSLLHEIDRTVTAMAGRLLRSWLLRPLVALDRIRDRLDAVEEFAFRSTDRGKFREVLKTRAGSRAPRRARGARQCRPARPRRPETVDCRRAPRAARPRRVRSAAHAVARQRARRSHRRSRRHRPHPRRRSRRAGTRRRVHPRRPRRRARRPAAHQPIGQTGHRRARRARARSHGHQLSEGALQPRIRLLHRDIQIESACGAGRLPPQADHRRWRAVHHARAEGIRRESARRRRADPRARDRAVRAIARASGSRIDAHTGNRARAGGARRACRARGNRVACRTTSSRTCTTATRCRSSTGVIRLSSVAAAARSCRTTRRWTARPASW